MKALVIWLCFLLVAVNVLAQKKQGQSRIDSLLFELPKASDDTNKVKLLNNLSDEYESVDPEEALRYGYECLKLAESLKWPRGEAMAHRGLAGSYSDQSNYPKALEHGLAALDLYERTGHQRGIHRTLNLLGVTYLAAGDHAKAVDCYQKALRIAEASKDSSSILLYVNNLAVFHLRKKNHVLALDYFRKSLAMARNLGDRYTAAVASGNIGTVYGEQKNYPAALAFLYAALPDLKAANEMGAYSAFLSTIGYYYLELAADSTLAGVPDSLQGKSYLLVRAEAALDTALAIATRLKNLRQMQDANNDLSRVYRMQGKYREALQAQSAAVALKDSIESQENQEKIEALTKQREEDLKQKEIDLQKVEIAKAKQERWFYSIGLVGLLLIVALVTLVLVNTRKAKRLSDHLLHNILPVHTANELKANGHAKAKRYDNVTVLFTDFKEFAKLAEKLSPEETVSLIHHYFTHFDKIVERHGLEKIKTIGDAYMAAAGVPVENPNHAVNAVHAAIAIREFVESEMKVRAANNQPFFEIRIGVHSGPVVAGIVGVKKFAYDIWGETVNLAARMESSGEPGRVNISGSTYALIKDRFVCHQRGAVQVKHGGSVEMFFVESEAKEAVVA